MSLQEKYRPQTFDDVLGHRVEVKAIKKQLQSDDGQKIFVLVGPGGIGKTSLAFLIAKAWGCKYPQHINAAKNGSKDELNELVEQMMYAPMDGSDTKVVIIDEIHAISKAAWDTLLIPLEFAQTHARYIMCTTELGKIPDTIKRRCVFLKLDPIPDGELRTYVELIARNEHLALSGEILDLVTKEAFGSVGQALMNLDTVSAAETVEEAAKLLHVTDISDSSPVGQLGQLLIKFSKSWSMYQPLIAQIVAKQETGVKFALSAYISKVMMSKTDGDHVKHLMRVLDAVEQMPSFLAPREIQSALLMLVGRMMFM